MGGVVNSLVMNARRALYLKLALGVFAAFAFALSATFWWYNRQAVEYADQLIDTAFDDIRGEIEDATNVQMLRQCYEVRERLAAGYPSDSASLLALAKRLRISEIHLADSNGNVIASSERRFLAEGDRKAFNFAAAGGQAAEMMCLLVDRNEYCQEMTANSSEGLIRKYVGVWRPEGGFVEVGCDADAMQQLVRSSLVDITHGWRIGATGGIVVTTAEGLVLSDYEPPFSRDGTQWVEPKAGFHWRKEIIESFPVYVLLPLDISASERDQFVVLTAAFIGLALLCVAIFGFRAVSGFERRQSAERTAREMKLARDIQSAALPNVFPPFPDEPAFDIYASMIPAKEVGGDFYDFYFTGPDRLMFLVADVSGKGVSGAMVMMRAKTLLKSAAQTGKPLSQVFAETNDAICEGNASSTFVTVWAGELDLRTGRVAYVNAGHNPPVVRRAGGCETLKSRPSLPLGAMAGVPYRVGELQLAPGDDLYLYTDGITEQPDAEGRQFGERRLLELLAVRGRKQRETLEEIHDSVLRHADGAAQEDDCTQVLLRYRGPAKVARFEYRPTMEDLAKATDDLAAALVGVPEAVCNRLRMAADEMFANIVRYSGATGWSLTVEMSHHPDRVRIILTDDGKPFDPLAVRDPDVTLSAEERGIGGLGILIVKKTMSPVTYRRRDGRNILSMGKEYGNQS